MTDTGGQPDWDWVKGPLSQGRCLVLAPPLAFRAPSGLPGVTADRGRPPTQLQRLANTTYGVSRHLWPRGVHLSLPAWFNIAS